MRIDIVDQRGRAQHELRRRPADDHRVGHPCGGQVDDVDGAAEPLDPLELGASLPPSSLSALSRVVSPSDDALVSVVFFLWNLVLLIRIKLQAIAAHIAKIDVGAKGTLVAFHNDSFPDPAGLIAYATRLAGTVKLRPDNRLAVTRAWGDPQARLNGLLQLTKGLAGIVVKAKR